MEYVLAALIILAIPVLGVAGFVRTVSLSRRLARAERRIELLAAELAAGNGAAPVPTASPVPRPEAPEALRDGAPEQEPESPAPLPAGTDEETEPAPDLVGADAAPAPLAPAGPSAPSRSFEEVIGTRWAVWVGGVALALGGIFLVRYSIEQGWFGPGARLVLGILFAIALAAGGEVLRRRDLASGNPAVNGPAGAHVPSVLVSAGTLVAFATVYAAHALYGMIGPAFAFVLLALVGVGSLAAAAIQGPVLAAVGLLASFAAPLLVSSSRPDAWSAIVYLLVVAGAGYSVARIRLWLRLAIATAAGAGVWGVLLVGGPHSFQLPALLHVVLQTGLAAWFLAVQPYAGARLQGSRPDRTVVGVLAGFAVLAAVAFAAGSGLGGSRPVLALAEAGVLLAAAWAAAPVAAAAMLAALLSVAVLGTWPVARESLGAAATVLPGPLLAPAIPDATWLFLLTGLALGAGLLASGWLRLMRGEGLALLPASLHAAAAVTGPVALVAAAWLRVEALQPSLPFSLVALVLGIGLAYLARGFAGDGDGRASHLVGLEAFAAGAMGALSLGLAILLEANALTVALALSALGAAWVTTRTGLNLLRGGVGVLAVLTAIRFALDPGAGIDGVGATPVFNALLWTYGAPALAFWIAGRLLRARREDRVVDLCEAVSVSLAGLLVAFELRHFFSGGDMFAARPGHLEVGLDVFVALLASAVLVGLGSSRASLILRVAAYAYGGLGTIGAIGGLLAFNNPLLEGSGESVLGGAVFNSLLVAYALPAVAAAWLSVRARTGRPWMERPAQALAFLLGLAWLVMEIRRLYQGPDIGLWRETSQSELYTYTAALLAIGLGALAWGIARGSRAARLVSAVLVLLAVAKAFLVDMAGLEGAWRALSFIGLGLVLVGIGLAYQKLVFGRALPPPAGTGGSGAAPAS